MPAGEGASEWTLSQLGEVFGSLAALATIEGKVGLLTRLAPSLDADATACALQEAQLDRGLDTADRGALMAAVAAHPGTGATSFDVELPVAGPMHVLVAHLGAAPGEWVGAVRRVTPFGERERMMLLAVGAMLELSLSSSRAIAKLQERNALLGVLREVEHAISAQHSLADTLQRLTSGVRLLFGRVMAGVVLDRDGQLELVAGAPQSDPPKIVYPLELTHADRLRDLIRGTTVVEIDDYREVPNPNPVMVALGIRRVLIAPIRPGAEPLGCIMVAVPDTERRFSADEREALRLLADHAGVAIDSARAREALAASVVELERRAVTDDLTLLLNRRGLFAAIEAALARRPSDRGAMSVLFIDFDRFKFVNDVYGHHVADQVLVDAAARLSTVVGDGLVGRLAGDEFVVLLDGGAAAGADLATRLRSELEQPFDVAGHSVQIGVSIGVAELNGHGSASQVLMDADLAMMEAKQRGRGRSTARVVGLRAEGDHQTGLERSIRDALARNCFDLHLQPIVDIASGRFACAEVLLRWSDAIGTKIAPGSVLAVAGEAGLLPVLDMAVLAHALRVLTDVRGRAEIPDLAVAVNVTPATLSLPDLADRVLDALSAADLAPCALALEFAETSALDFADTIENLERLLEAGVSLALDNFGAGWSSLSRLRRVPLSRLKIDHSFTSEITTHESAAVIVTGLLQLAPAVGLDVVAEGVETPEQAAWLAANGCDYGQGYHFGRPVSVDEFIEVVRSRRLVVAPGPATLR